MIAVLLGGHGGSEARYAATAAELGYRLVYAEHKLPSARYIQLSQSQVAVVLLPTGTSSHAQRQQARDLCSATGARLVQLRTATVSAVKAALQQLGQGAR